MPSGSRKSPIKVGADQRSDLCHGLYRIIAGATGGQFQAFAYLGMKRIHVLSGDSMAGVVAEMTAEIDRRAKALRRNSIDEIPSEAEFREVLTALATRKNEFVFSMLHVHRQFNGYLAAPKDIARRSGADEATVMLEYAKFGRRVGSLLNFSPALDGWDRAVEKIAAFCLPEPHETTGQLLFRMRPEVAYALGVEPRNSTFLA